MDITFHGATLDHKVWAKLKGVTESTLRWRLAHWGVERALTENKIEEPLKKPRRKARKLTDNERVLICTAYIEGQSEDTIAGLIGRSRKTVSNVLVKRGLKIKGKAPKRVVVIDDETTGAHIHIHLHK